jgi:Fur family transcriptional regulator, peroxide stress response regulator
MKPLPPIDAPAKQDRLQEFERLCRERGIPLTPQRRLVLQAVLELNCHPTADQIHAAPEVRRAGISRATVYRTLESLARLGVITKACHPHGVVRYDGRVEQHHHLVCLRCDAVVDVAAPELDALPLPDASVFGFKVKNYRVQLRGLCRRCQKKEEK